MTAPSQRSLDDLRRAFADLPPPVVIFNKSHSGSRLLAALFEASGLFMGHGLNESRDADVLLPLVSHVVERYHPGYEGLWQTGGTTDATLVELVESSFAALLRGRGDRPWGWKLCETVYMLPLVDFLFPGARYVHLIRDGRDVAFCDHVAPVAPFWQKVYLDAVGVRRWRGLLFGPAARFGYRLDSSRYNVQHWVNSVTLGRRYGAMLRERYLEVRYEALCRDFDREGRRVLAFAGAPEPGAGLDALRSGVTTASIGKFRRHNPVTVARVKRYARPLLIALDYLD